MARPGFILIAGLAAIAIARGSPVTAQETRLRITKADPWVKGDTASGDTKPATLETGYELQVPPFVEEGEKVRIDTRTGQYVERVKG